jgi:hypothetical protein
MIFSKALEKRAPQLGEAVCQNIEKLWGVLRQKFQKEGVEGKLERAVQEPTEKNQTRFEEELKMQMEDDEDFTNQLLEIIGQLKSNEIIQQSFFSDVRVKGDVEIGSVSQATSGYGAGRQQALEGVEVGGNLKIGSVDQKC